MCVPALAAIGPAISTAVGSAGTAIASTGLTTLQTISLGLSGASAVAGAYGSIQASRTQAAGMEATARAQESAARANLRRGQDESDRLRLAGNRMLGEQRARMAANGIDPSSPSALDVLGDTRTLFENDALAIREQSYEDARGNAQTAANLQSQAGATRISGRNAAFGTVLDSAGRVSAKWDAWKNA